MSGLRIYVACLAAYNSGRLHGRWIDCTPDAEEMAEEVREMLFYSPCPNVTGPCLTCEERGTVTHHNSETGDTRQVECHRCKGTGMAPRAEEWAIHDTDGFPSGTVGEFSPLSEVAQLAAIFEAAEEEGFDGDVLLEAMKDAGALDEDPSRWLGDHFCRTVEAGDESRAWADMAEELAEDTIYDLPEWVRGYIDWEAMGRDMRLNGDFQVYEGNPCTFHFFNA